MEKSPWVQRTTYSRHICARHNDKESLFNFKSEILKPQISHRRRSKGSFSVWEKSVKVWLDWVSSLLSLQFFQLFLFIYQFFPCPIFASCSWIYFWYCVRKRKLCKELQALMVTCCWCCCSLSLFYILRRIFFITPINTQFFPAPQ